jgi:S-formylglutathione hydrolase FrmB
MRASTSRILRAIAVAIAVVYACAPIAPQRAEADDSPKGLKLLSERRVSRRIVDLQFQTTALANPTPVRVLLPSRYDPSRRYPVLYLLHGGGGNEETTYKDWTTNPGAGKAIPLTEGLPLIVVMPAGGRSAWYTDYYNNGTYGFPMWETYHMGQLIGWIDRHFPTVANRSGRAIAGLSSGGFGAMSYASRHPDLFVSAAAFSGAVDTNTPMLAAPVVIDGLVLIQRDGPPGSLWGQRASEEVRWRGHNPWDLAENLRGMSLTFRTGDGQEGGTYGGGGPTDPVGGGLEGQGIYPQNMSMHNLLDELRIRHVFEVHHGTHSYAYWNRDLKRTLPLMMRVFWEHRPSPSRFTFKAVEPAYEMYGWNVSFRRDVLEFSTLTRRSVRAFSISGSGSATVTTPPSYRARRTYIVSERGDFGTRKVGIRAGRDGRLRISVPLGPSNSTQQMFDADGNSPATSVYTTQVTVSKR